MSAPSLPLWLTILGTLGVGGLLGTFVTLWFTARQQHKNWVKDNKRLEWRELIDGLHVAMTRMACRFSPPPNTLRRINADTDWEDGMRTGSKLIHDRIFIASKVRNNIGKHWDELIRYVASVGNPREPGEQGNLPTPAGYALKVTDLEDLIMRVCSKDLGTD